MGRKKGYKHSDETIEKIRRAAVGRVLPEPVRKKISESRKKRKRKEITIVRSIRTRYPYLPQPNPHHLALEVWLETWENVPYGAITDPEVWRK